MRQTFSELIATTEDYVSKHAGNLATSTVEDFIKEHLNKRYQHALSVLADYKTQWTPRTCVTVANQQYYYNPPDMNTIESATMTIGGRAWPLRIVNSYSSWNQLNKFIIAGTIVPQFIFPRQRDFGIWPIPKADGYTVTLVGNLQDVEMTVSDYVTGTVNLTQNSQVVTGVATTFTSSMVGRWFKATGGDKRWYRIATYVTATDVRLETYYEGNSVNGVTYVIGESPNLPDEIHEILPHGAAADFYAGPAKDFAAAQAMINYYFTGDFNNGKRTGADIFGGLLGAKIRYAERGNTAIINKNPTPKWMFDERWTTTLT